MIFLKKINAIILILVFVICFIVYKSINLSFSPQILPRKTIKAPLEGTWIVNKYIFIDNSSLSETSAKGLLGKQAVFNREGVYFDNNICKNPNFKVKVVNTKSYFWNKFKIKSSDVGISENKVKVITVSSNNSFFDEYIQISDTHIVKCNDGLLIFLKNQGEDSGEPDLDKFDEGNSKLIISNFQKDVTSKSGILLGLRYKDDNNKGYSYRTLWISCKYGNFSPTMETKDLLVPRKNGFWKIGVEKKLENEVEKSVLWGAPLNKDINNIKHLNTKEFVIGNVNSNIQNNVPYNNIIQFVGNEYISLDNQTLNYDINGTKENYFGVVPIDKLYGNKVEFSKAFGKDAGDSLKRSSQLYLRRLNNNEGINEGDLETNWAVIRRNGRWVLRGRIPQGDFDIAFDTPKILTTYDDLYPSFNEIKQKVPEVVDAYTSPNKDFLVIFTKTNLKVFSINGNDIGEIKIDLKLNPNEQPVMSQWATGNYVDEWAKLLDEVKLKSDGI